MKRIKKKSRSNLGLPVGGPGTFCFITICNSAEECLLRISHKRFQSSRKNKIIIQTGKKNVLGLFFLKQKS
jgi:hypothetical protein